MPAALLQALHRQRLQCAEHARLLPVWQVHRQAGYYPALVQRALGGLAHQEQLSQDEISNHVARHAQLVGIFAPAPFVCGACLAHQLKLS